MSVSQAASLSGPLVMAVTLQGRRKLARSSMVTRPSENIRQSVSEKDIVAQNKPGRAAVHEFFGDYKRLRYPFRPRLDGVADFYSPLRAVAQQGFEGGQVARRGNQQDVVHSGQQ